MGLSGICSEYCCTRKKHVISEEWKSLPSRWRLLTQSCHHCRCLRRPRDHPPLLRAYKFLFRAIPSFFPTRATQVGPNAIVAAGPVSVPGIFNFQFAISRNLAPIFQPFKHEHFSSIWSVFVSEKSEVQSTAMTSYRFPTFFRAKF